MPPIPACPWPPVAGRIAESERTGHVRRSPLLRGVFLIAAGVAMLALAGACGGSTPAGASDPAVDAPPPVAATVDLNTLPAATATLYRVVDANAAVAARLACYCGCGPAQGHRSLADCFLTPSGAYDAHASGCGVCLGEAQQMRTLLDSGADVPAIRQQIDARWSSSGPATETS